MLSANMDGAETTSVRRCRRHNGDEGIVDRISALPDALLSHILYFLPIDQAVKTCLLSKRRRFVWNSMSKLEFIKEDLIPRKIKRNRGKSSRLLEKFVDGVLGVRGSSHIMLLRIDSYSLWFCPIRVCSWISTAIMCNVENLILIVGGSEYITLPPSLFTCQGLQALKLHGPFSFEVPDSVCLNKLKTLSLSDTKFDDSSLNKFLSSCALEELDLNRWGHAGSMSNICSPSLKHLCISDWIGFKECNVVIDTPALEHITLSIQQQGWKKDYILKSSPSLKVAHFVLYTYTILNPNLYVELLKSVSNIKQLAVLFFDKNLHIGDEFHKLPMFHNLTHLEVEMDRGSWKYFPILLDRSPNSISLKLVLRDINFGWQLPDLVAECLSSHLKTVLITGFNGQDPYMQLVEYLLKSGKVLDKMIIQSKCSQSPRGFKLDPNLKADILTKLLLLPRGSNSCQVAFS